MPGRVFRRVSSADREGQRTSRVRAALLIAIGAVGFGGVVSAIAAATTPPAYAATASLTPALRYVGDATGSTYSFTVKNTGTTASIGAVEINRPLTWTVAGCPTPPAGWTATASSTKCRFRSAASTSDDIKPGQTRVFNVKAKTDPGTTNRTGRWQVVVSKSNQFDNTSLLKTASPADSGLTQTLYTFEVTGAVVADLPSVRGTACPAPNTSAVVDTTKVIVVCGRNHASAALTPTSTYSTLKGSYVTAKGAFVSGSIPKDSPIVVLGSWSGVEVPATFGEDYKVIASIGSASNRTSPVRTFAGYVAMSRPALPVDDAYPATEDTALTPAAGVLANDTDPDGDALTAKLVDGPDHGTLTLNSDGTFTYTPAQDYHGSDSFTYVANDSHTDSAPATVAITVAPVNDAPVAGDDTAATTENATVATPLLGNDADVDGDSISITSVTSPTTAGSLNVAADGTATFDPGTDFDHLDAGEPATKTYEYSIVDGHGGTDTGTLTITITGVNDAPESGVDAGTTDEDTPVVIDLTGNDTDADGDAVTIAAIGTGPAIGTKGTVTDNGDGTVTYDPNGEFEEYYAPEFATDTFTYDASDGHGGVTTVTVTVRVNGLNDGPDAVNDAPGVGEDDGATALDLRGNDLDPEGGLSVTAVDTTGTTGVVTIVSGDVTYDPDGKFEDLTTGEPRTDTFTYTVEDPHGATDTATVTVTVTGVNDAPEAGDETANVGENATVTIDLLNDDTDAESQALAVTTIGSSTGKVTDNGDGTVTYDPDGKFEGLSAGDEDTDTFLYSISDGAGGTDTATVVVTIVGVNDAPGAVADPKTTTEDAPATVDVLGNDTDAEGDTLTVSAVDTTGTLGQVTNNGTDVTYDPNGQFEHLGPNQDATDTFTYTVSDGQGGTATTTVTVTVTGVNDTPDAAPDGKSTTEDATTLLSVLANDTDDEGAVTITAVSTAGTTGKVTDNGDGTLTYDPDGKFEDLAAGEDATDTFTYTVTDAHQGTDTATVTITVTGVNDAPVAAGDAKSTSEDAATTVAVLGNDTDDESQTLTVSGVDTTGTSGTVTNNGTDVTYDPNGMFEYLDSGETATDTFTYTVSDTQSGTGTATVTITVTGVNDAPVANADGPFTTLQDQPLTLNTPGVLANDTDADGETLTAGNASDPDHGTVTLNADGSFDYTPDTGYTGSDSFTYDVSDGTVTASATVTLTVVPPNDAPTVDAVAGSGSEDGSPFSIGLVGHDADGDALTFAVGTATNGVVTGPTGTSCDTNEPSQCTATVTYTPNANFFGTDTFTYTANDGTLDSAPAVVTVTVTPVNDEPSFTKGGNQTVNEDAGGQTVTGWATAIAAGPGETQIVSFTVTNDNAALFSSAPAVNGAGDLTYTPAVDGNGVATVTVKAVDDGGTANGGDDTSPGQTFTITVNAVNDAPSFTKGADQTVAEDSGAHSVSNWATGISEGPADEVAPQTVSFTTSNDNNTLFSMQPGITAAGTLTYTPTADAVGSATVTVTLSDTGGTANGGDDTSDAVTFTITVTPVNDAPSATVAGNQTVLEDAGAQTVNGFVTGTSAGPGDESGQTVTVAVTDVTNSSLFSAQPTLTNGVLTYTPAADANGASTVTVVATDNGGTAGGGDATGNDVTFTITVTAVNDVPSFTKGAGQTVGEDSGAHSVSNWATAISKGPADESGQLLTFVVTNDNNGLFSAQPAVSPTGTLSYTPAANQYGSATVSVALKDNGGTANGGDDTSDVQTFTITVTPVNDAPVAAPKSYTVQANMKISLSGLLTGATDPNDSPVPAGQPAYTPSFTEGSVTAGAGCVGCTITNTDLTDGVFELDPPAGGTGTYTLDYTVVDSGHPGPGATSATQTITITVNGPVIWFVDTTAAAGGTGRLSHAFNTLAAATTEMGSTVNERIFVKGGNVSGNVTLPTDGWLLSEAVTGAVAGDDFDDVMGIAPPAGTIARPAINGTQRTLTGGVTLGQSSVVRGFDISSGSTNGLVGSGKTGLVVNQVSVTSTTGRAVDLANSSGVFNLRRVSSNGATRGISLVNTNVSTGSFTVTGTGTAGSGGTIQNSTGTGTTTFGVGEGGIHLSNTKNVTLDRMNVTNGQGSGIYGTDVHAFSLANSTVTGNGSDHGKDHDGIHFDTVTGSVSITNTTVSGSRENNVRFRNNSGTSNITITGSTLSTPHTSFGANNLILDTYNNAVATLNASGNTISSAKTAGIAVYGNSTGTMTANIGANTLTGNQQGVDLGGNGTGASTFVVDGVTATGCSTCGAQLHAYKGSQATGSPMLVTFRNNSVNGLGSQLAAGIWVHGEGPGALRGTITNNTVRGIQHFGIYGGIGNGGHASMDLNISNNDVDLSAAGGNASYAIYVENGLVPGDQNATCANIKSNKAVTVAPLEGIAVSNWNSTGPFRLPGYAGANDGAAESFIVSGNVSPVTAEATSNGVTFTGGAACNTP